MEQVVYTLCFGWYLRCHSWIAGMRVFWSFSVPTETSILPFRDSGPSAAFCAHHPTAALLDFLSVLLSEQMCQHLVTDGCLQQWTQSLNIPHRLQEMLGAHLRDRLAAPRSTGWGKQLLPWETWGRIHGRWQRRPRANCCAFLCCIRPRTWHMSSCAKDPLHIKGLDGWTCSWIETHTSTHWLFDLEQITKTF